VATSALDLERTCRAVIPATVIVVTQIQTGRSQFHNRRKQILKPQMKEAANSGRPQRAELFVT
jgi:hypothetical protein